MSRAPSAWFSRLPVPPQHPVLRPPLAGRPATLQDAAGMLEPRELRASRLPVHCGRGYARLPLPPPLSSRRQDWAPRGPSRSVASLLLCLFVLWHLGRRLLNRLAHMSHGNNTLIQLVDNEAIYEIAGSRSGRTHRVWVDLKLCAAACGCRAYLTEGVCGHADSALAAAKAAGLCGSSATAGRTSVASQEDADSAFAGRTPRSRCAPRPR